MTIEIVVSSARCMGSKTCTHAAEGVFVMTGDVARVVNPDAAPLEDILAAAEGCPTGAINVKKDGRQL
jgi:ferredoxin